MAQPPLSLIPVHLKEASLDSPTFRATATHFSEQIEQIERWLDSLIKTSTRLCHEISGLEDLIRSWVTKFTLKGVSESIIDHDYTLLSMARFGGAAGDFWEAVGTLCKRTESILVESLVGFQRTELRSFKDCRRNFDLSQQRYDGLLQRYASQPKTKEPSALREDAFQLYEARKAYLKLSFDLVLGSVSLRTALDRILTRTASDLWKEQTVIHNRSGSTLQRYKSEIERIRSWSDNMEASEKLFKEELVSARRQMEKVKEPIRELEEYASSTVQYLSSKGRDMANAKSDPIASEKHGWLFVKTMTGSSKTTRSVWVRKWFFVKDGIFSWLVQGSKTGGVEEGEKIGILLCSVRPAFAEDRRFVFEVKTSKDTHTLQAETQAELTSWIEVFEAAKKLAVETASTSLTSAFAISPPVAKELAADTIAADDTLTAEKTLNLPSAESPASLMRASVDTGRRPQMFDDSHPVPSSHSTKIIQKLDRQKTSLLRSDPSSGLSGPSGIGALISASHALHNLPQSFPQPTAATPQKPNETPSLASSVLSLDTASRLAPLTLANPPMPTNLSKQSIDVLLGATTHIAAVAVPGSFMANHWGSVHWGHEADRDESNSKDEDSHSPRLEYNSSEVAPAQKTEVSPPKHRKAASVDIDAHIKGPQSSQTGLSDKVSLYPPQYPAELKAHDSQFRILFPKAAISSERILMVFRATWNPNNAQEFPSRVYVTSAKIFIYGNFLGVVLVKSFSLGSISDITISPDKDFDLISFRFHQDDDSYDRIVLKVFLENAKLLHRRLKLLLDSFNTTEERPSTQSLIHQLCRIENEFDSPKTEESWEEIGDEFRNIEIEPFDQNRAVNKGKKVIEPSASSEKRDTLPGQAVSLQVIYQPKDMEKKFFERDHDISPKALFHILFGDKSAVFSALYRRRRTSSVLQGPWLPTDGIYHTREFTYQASSVHDLPVIRDNQVIEKQDDVCYVVSWINKPWHLPCGDLFKLEMKIVITAVAQKNKSRLAIWSAIRWKDKPKFLTKDIVERHALSDHEVDVQDLGNIVNDQTRRLGGNVKITRAIQLFGHIGSLQSSYSLGDKNSENYPLAPITKQSLEGLIFSMISVLIVSAANSVIHSIPKLLKRTIMLVLIVSLAMNFYSLNLHSLWRSYATSRFINTVGIKPGQTMWRGVLVEDIFALKNRSHTAYDTNSECFSKFKYISGLDSGHLSSEINVSPHASQVGRRIQLSRQRFGTYRHDLMVALRVLDSLERSLFMAEYERWLLLENKRCDFVLGSLTDSSSRSASGTMKKPNLSKDTDRKKTLIKYCSSCERELDFFR